MAPKNLLVSESDNSFASGTSSVSVQRRRRKHVGDSVKHINNNNLQGASYGRNINSSGSGQRRSSGNSASVCGWFRRRRGNRKQILLECLVAGSILSFWLALLRYEYNVVVNGSHSSHGPDSGRFAPSFGGSKPSGGYDAIFCRASSDSHSSWTEATGVNTTSHRPNPVFLWGIPSTSSAWETGRRKLLRQTYLQFYDGFHGDAKKDQTASKSVLDETHPPHTICSLQEWTCDAKIRSVCQMVYVFFIGGHPGLAKNQSTPDYPVSPVPPPILLNESIVDFREMLVPLQDGEWTTQSGGFDATEPGAVYLDIRENQFDGKMTTWFKFASLVASEYNIGYQPKSMQQDHQYTQHNNILHTNNYPTIEYVFKVDSDLILFTPHFFRWFESVHQKQQMLQQGRSSSSKTTPIQRVYGGIEFPSTNCLVNFTFDHPCPLPLSGRSYMSGELNFASVDLATYIASDDCPRDKWTIPHEDVSLSNYVYSYISNTKYHTREKLRQHNLLSSKPTNAHNAIMDTEDDKDHSIHIVGVNTSQVLLLPNMRANWETVSLRKNPNVLRSGELLWAHSIKRANYTQYLYWKKDNKFRNFWRVFYRLYTTTGNVTLGGRTRFPKHEAVAARAAPSNATDRNLLRNSSSSNNIQHTTNGNSSSNGSVANLDSAPRGIDFARLLREKRQAQAF